MWTIEHDLSMLVFYYSLQLSVCDCYFNYTENFLLRYYSSTKDLSILLHAIHSPIYWRIV
jgi:hypothetical protein